MKQTQADFEQGYQTALKDIEDKKKEHPEWSMKHIAIKRIERAPQSWCYVEVIE